MLSQEQYQHFQTFGFIVLRQVFTPDELATIDREFEAGLNAAHAENPFDGSERHFAILTGAETPFFAHLPEDPRFYEIAEQLYGADCFAMTSDANRYVGDSRWHPDHNIDLTKDCYGIKFAYYLDPVDAETGALRVIPGSHKNPLHSDIEEKIKTLGLDIRDLPAYVCTSDPGDLVAFDVRLWHASCGGRTGRRMCTVVTTRIPAIPAKNPVCVHVLPAVSRQPHPDPSSTRTGLPTSKEVPNARAGSTGCATGVSWKRTEPSPTSESPFQLHISEKS